MLHQQWFASSASYRQKLGGEGGRAHLEAAREGELRELARTLRDEVRHADRDYIWKRAMRYVITHRLVPWPPP
jgi:hypothetical protein